MKNVLIVRSGRKTKKLFFEAPSLLSDILEEGSISVPKPCGGRGNCGKCKVELTGAVSEPNEQEQYFGARLMCQAIILGDAEVRIHETAPLKQIEIGGAKIDEVVVPEAGKLGAAIDIGTTTLAVRVYDLNIEKMIGELGEENPQRVFSADVVGRISAALEGDAESLRTTIINGLKDIINRILFNAGRSGDQIDTLVITGNTTMLYLLLGQNVECLSRAPFKADRLFDEEVELLGGHVYLPPCISSFVGADISCAVLSSGMCRTNETKMLCDIGTNGEIALWNDGTLYVTSTAAGPAFEGAGISCGCGSIQGAIDRVWIKDGCIRFHTIDELPPVGLCGSGLLDALAAFLNLNVIDETGAIKDNFLVLAPEVKLTKADIRSLQLAKAAIAAGIETLLKISEVKVDQITELYISGGFGRHINVSSAVQIGLIPSELGSKVRFIGNGALAGAEKLLLNKNCRAEIQQIVNVALPVNLGGNLNFNDCFVDHLGFDSRIADF